jgi:hypothetical protein
MNYELILCSDEERNFEYHMKYNLKGSNYKLNNFNCNQNTSSHLNKSNLDRNQSTVTNNKIFL